MRRLTTFLIPVALLATPGAVCAQAAAYKPDTPAAIAACEDMDSAGRLYAQAWSEGKDDPSLHRAYVRRALQLGRPMMVMLSAQELVRLEPRNALGWGLIGYVYARRGRPEEALAATLRAGLYGGTDPSTLHNLGMLARWYEDRQKKVHLPPSLKNFLDENLSLWRTQQAFSDAYDACDVGYQPIKDQRIRQGEQIDRLVKSEKEIAARLADCDRAYQRNNEEIVTLTRRIELENRTIEGFRADPDLTYEVRAAYNARAARTIYESEQTIQNCHDDNVLLKRQAAELQRGLVVLRRKTTSLKRLVRVSQLKMPDVLWAPPAVDGKVTAALGTDDVPIAKSAPPVEQPPPQRQLQLAKMLLSNEKNEQALYILQALIREYPNTEHAQRAQAIIDEHKLDYKPARE